ncbi:hypothetical protein QEZ54_08555 [Catellatospora sp. KI3]|uniref:hypothetical protein n=1 Tax=Catellatospora sp. KI3 TaxID=3041620 RepID=UPI0024823AF3|nr:hypothetical protein [Catellatospora sp. KI3]MDI1461012.1 hypothetical protein [Catellatospora sp. KI3]
MSSSREAVQAAQAIAGIRQGYFQNLVMCGVTRADIADLERQLAADTTITLPRGLAQYSELLAVLGGRSTYVSNLKTMLQLGLWEHHKIVYRLDADLAHDLGNLGDGDVIHREVLRRLPHPNPYIHLPSPILFTSNSRRTMQVRGFFVSGSRYDGDDPVLCSTHHPQRQHLVLLFPRLPHPAADHSADADMSEIEFSRFNLKFAGPTATLGELIADVQRHFTDHTSNMPAEDVATLLRTSIAPILYTCTVDPDIRRTAAGHSKKHRWQGRAVTAYDLGYRLGDAIRSWKAARVARSQTAGTGTGATRRPHWRKPHLHTYRVGVGRTETVIRYLSGLPVNGYTGTDVPTVIPV